jgi:hypothetical protein
LLSVCCRLSVDIVSSFCTNATCQVELLEHTQP